MKPLFRYFAIYPSLALLLAASTALAGASRRPTAANPKYVFFFVGDILITYSILGLLLFTISRSPDRALKRWVIASIASWPPRTRAGTGQPRVGRICRRATSVDVPAHAKAKTVRRCERP